MSNRIKVMFALLVLAIAVAFAGFAGAANAGTVSTACSWNPGSQHGYCTFTLYRNGAYYGQKSGNSYVLWPNLPTGNYQVTAVHCPLWGTSYFSFTDGFVEVWLTQNIGC